MSQLERDLNVLESFTYNTPCQEVFERVLLEVEKITSTNTESVPSCPYYKTGNKCVALDINHTCDDCNKR